MAVYYINLLLILGLAYPLCLYKPNKIKKAAYLAITFGYMWCLATFRYGIGFDYFSYIDIFERVAAAPSLSEALALSYEPGFILLTRLMSAFVTSPTAMYGVYATLIFVPMALAIYWYCKDAWLSTWLYVTLSYFYSSMSFIRQNLACGIVFLGYKFLRERKPVPYFLLVLLGASFHKTALIMIPLYFLSMIPLKKPTFFVYSGATVAAYLTSPWILDIVTNYIFTGYKGSIYIDTAYGFSLIFLLIPTVILGICLALFPVWRKKDTNANMLLSMMIFSWVIWLFITRHFILERFSHYPYMLALVAVPIALSYLKAPEEDYRALATLEENLASGKAKKSKPELHRQKELQIKIRDHKKYYWSAVAMLVFVTFLYNEFGQHVNGVNGFHNVFPYQSVFSQEKVDFSDDYYEKLAVNQERKERSQEMTAYLSGLTHENCVYVFAIKDEGTAALTAEVTDALKKLGLQSDFKDKYRYSYLAVIDGGAVAYEAISPEQLEHHFSSGGAEFSVVSAGMDVGNVASIQINGEQYSVNQRGMNIVIYDKTAGKVADSVVFDSHSDLKLYR